MLQFLLRDPQRYLHDPDALRTQLSLCKAWIQDLTSKAAELNMSRGQLCRQILPFSEHTDAQDQASSVAEEKDSLVIGAVNLRRFLRIKLSDENDLRQAIDALRLIEDELNSGLKH
jgi:hypothetical protein